MANLLSNFYYPSTTHNHTFSFSWKPNQSHNNIIYSELRQSASAHIREKYNMCDRLETLVRAESLVRDENDQQQQHYLLARLRRGWRYTITTTRNPSSIYISFFHLASMCIFRFARRVLSRPPSNIT